MSEPEKTKWVGQLSVELLFQGSKSEGLYPMLDTEDGRRFRVHVQGNQLSDAEALSDLIEKRVCLNGTADDLRGHWRLTLDPEQPGEVIPIEPDQIKSNPEVQLAPDANGDIS
jgi:hypothetical protein